MKTIIRSALAFLTVSMASACMDEPPNFGAFPAEDEAGVTAAVTKQDATAVAQLALEGINEVSYDKWSTNWDASLTAAIGATAFRDYVPTITGRYGRFVSVEATRLTAAATPGNIRYSFLAEFEAGTLMLVHVYPDDADRITGVHLRDADTGESP